MSRTQYDVCDTQYENTRYASRTTQYDMARKKNKNMQNEPNFKNTEMIVTACNISSYDNLIAFFRPKNEPKRSQNEPNFSPKLGSFFPKLALLFDKKMYLCSYQLQKKSGFAPEKVQTVKKKVENELVESYTGAHKSRYY